MFWIGAFVVMTITAIALIGVTDLIEQEEMEEEYETAYIVIYK